MNEWLKRCARLCVALTSLAWLCGYASGEEAPGEMALTALPTGMILRERSGRYVKLNDMVYPGQEQVRRPRQILVLNFMSSDCAPCRAEVPELLAFLRDVRTNGVTGYLISLDALSQGDRLDRFIAEMNVDCNVLMDPYRIAARKLGVVAADGSGGIPRTFVFAPDGRVVADLHGKQTDMKAALSAAVKSARP